MRIIGYTYEADYHCIECAKRRFVRIGIAECEEVDDNGILMNQEDSEGNYVHPVFSTDEIDKDCCCGDCFDLIT